MIGRAMTGAKTPMKSTAEPIIPRMSFLFIAISSPSKLYHLICSQGRGRMLGKIIRNCLIFGSLIILVLFLILTFWTLRSIPLKTRAYPPACI
jgi:hypothetical protein